jgi:hypothetical protein
MSTRKQIKRKITILSAFAIGIILIMTLASYGLNSYIKENFKAIKTKDLYAKNISLSLKDKMCGFHRYVLTELIKGNGKGLDKIELEILNQRITDDFDKLNKINIQNNDIEILASLGKLNIRYKSYYEIVKELPADTFVNGKSYGDFILINEISHKMFSELGDFVLQNDFRFNEQMVKIDAYITSMIVLFSVFSLVFLIFFTILGYVLGKNIVRDDHKERL